MGANRDSDDVSGRGVPDPGGEHHDVVIIGSGAGGGTLAHRLAPTGKRILLLERGDYLHRERDNWDSTAVFVTAVFVTAKYRAPEFWYDKHGREFPPEVNYYVGGNTKFFGAALFRLRPDDFGEIRHHGAISPAWPIGYQDLEPYYTEAEHLYLVHGRHGDDPTEGPAGAPYAHPPVQHAPRIQQLSDDLEKQGLHPFPLPIGINLTQDAHGRATHDSVCIRCDRVDGFPCLVQGKSDAQVICVDPALAEHHNLRLLTGARAQRLETDARGHTVTTVVTDLADGTQVRIGAGVVVVSCGADDWDYPLGGIQLLGKSDAEQVRANAPHWAGKLVPELPLEVLAHHAVDFWLCGEDLPDPDNRVTLGRDGAVHLALDEKNNIAGLHRLRRKLQGMLTDLGMHPGHLLDHSIYLHKGMPIGATAHQAGTVRFGPDPQRAALDLHCKAHDLDNLYVVDTSFFPSIGAVNPSLTAIANALRVGDHLADRLR